MGYLMQSAQMLAAASEGRLFGLDPQLLHDAVITGINIFLLFLLLSYLLFNPARKLLKERRERIQNEIDTANADRENALSMKTEYEGHLKNVNQEAEQILADARKKAMKNEAAIVAEAQEEAERIKKRARADMELEHKRALDDMKQEMVQIAAMMAGKALQSDMTPQIQEKLVDETLREMGDDTWQS